MKPTLTTDLTAGNIETALGFLSVAPGWLEALCRDRGEDELRRPVGPGERSVAEIIAHLLHTENRTAEAITLALLGDEPLLVTIHPERQFGKLYRYDRLSIAELLAYFRIRRRMLLNVLTDISEAQWARTVHEEGKQRRESVYWRVRTIIMHELDHLAEIGRIIGANPE